MNGKKNGKGKEYNCNGIIIFEGEFLNGKKNGKGKEYYNNGDLFFEGEYLYNFKSKGKGYNYNKLEYEGEYLYDKKWTGKGFDENGKIIYELINGNGTVKEYNFMSIYEGEYLNGKRNGRGKEYDEDMGSFEGEYLNGKKWNGKGYYYNGYLIYEISDGNGIEKNMINSEVIYYLKENY